MKIDGVFKDLESLVRYVAPGFTLLVLGVAAGHDFTDLLKSGYGLAFLPFVGIAWYALHRTVLNLLDYPIYWATKHRITLSYEKNLAPESKKNRGYVYARLANIHLAMIVAEQALIVSVYAKENESRLLWWGLVVVLVSMASYIATLHEICKYDERDCGSQQGGQPDAASRRQLP